MAESSRVGRGVGVFDLTVTMSQMSQPAGLPQGHRLVGLSVRNAASPRLRTWYRMKRDARCHRKGELVPGGGGHLSVVKKSGDWENLSLEGLPPLTCGLETTFGPSGCWKGS